MNQFTDITSKLTSFVSTISIGLDIGTDSIKFIKLQRKKGSYELLSYGVVPVTHLKSRSREEQSIAISDILGDLLNGEKKAVDIFTVVSGSRVTIKTISLPRMPKAELEKAIQWAGKKHVPVPLEETNFGYRIVGEIEEDKIIKNEVVIVAAEKDLINDRVDLYHKSGLKVAGISVVPFALWNLLRMTKTGPPTIAWIDIGAKFTTIAIFQNNILKFSREILTAGDSITESIRSSSSLPDEEAEKLKREYGVLKQDNRPEIARAITPVIGRLIGEIRRSFSFHQQRHPESSIEKVYLTGGTARLKGLSGMMEEGLGIDAEVINPLEKIKTDLSPMEKAKLSELAPALSVATGLALDRGKRINLAPTEIKEQRAMARLMPILRTSAISLIAILSLLYMYAGAQVRANKKSLDVWKTTVQSLTPTAFSDQQIAGRIDQIKRMKQTIERLEQHEILMPFILKKITTILPKSIALKSLSIAYPGESPAQETAEGESVSAEQEPVRVEQVTRFQIEGVVCGEEASLEVVLARFMITLDSLPFLKNPALLSQERTVLNRRDVLEFKASCELQ